MTAERLWDREPSLWEEAKAFQLVRPLSPVFGWEGPSGGAFGNGPRGANGWTFTGEIHLGNPGAPVAPPGPAFTGPVGESVNISNERVQSSLWGTPDRLVLSLGKSDVYNRAGLGVTKGKKPVGQLLLMMEDFADAAQPHVATSLHNGNNLLRLAKGAGNTSPVCNELYGQRG